MTQRNYRAWRHVWLLAKGWYEGSDDRFADLRSAVAAHTGCEASLKDVAAVLHGLVIEHIGCFKNAQLAAQGTARLLEYETPFVMGEDNRTFLERRIDGFISYLRLQVHRTPDEFNSFVLGDLGEPDEEVLPVGPGAVERMREMAAT